MVRLDQLLSSLMGARPSTGRARSPRRYPRRFRLRDGGLVWIRPVVPADRASLVEGFAQLSSESRYSRFFSVRKELSDAELDKLTHLDGVLSYALAAVAHDGKGAELPLGVARFVRERPQDSEAEAAVTVTDPAQGRGVGSLLLTELSREAYTRGIRQFTGSVLATNEVVLKMLRHQGSAMHIVQRRAGLVDLTLELRAPRPSWVALGRRLREALRNGRLSWARARPFWRS